MTNTIDAERVGLELRKRWEAALKLPADEYLKSRLESAGLPTDVTQVQGRTCSFWAKEEGYVWGLPCVSTIAGIGILGQGLKLFLSSGPYDKPCSLTYVKEWSCVWDGSKSWEVVGFRLL